MPAIRPPRRELEGTYIRLAPLHRSELPELYAADRQPRGVRGRLGWRTGRPPRDRGRVRRVRPRLLLVAGRQRVRRAPQGRARRRSPGRHIHSRRLRRDQRAHPHRLDRVRPARVGDCREPRGQAAHARRGIRSRLRPREAAGGCPQLAFPRRDRQARRGLRGHRAPRSAARGWHVARHRDVLDSRRRVAHGACRS